MQWLSVNNNQELWLVVGSETSTIGQAAETALLKNFNVIKTSKNENGERVYLDICNLESIQWFIKNFIKKYPWKKIKVLFLNAGSMIAGDTISRWNFFKRVNDGEMNINTHVYNIVLVESLQREGIIDKNTKIIYNSSVQIFSPKEWFEDYAKLKNMVSTILLEDKDLDVSVLILSLVKWTHMTKEFEKNLRERDINIDEYIKDTMPEWQPSLDQVEYITEKIIEHKQETKGKFICLDWGITRNLSKDISKDCIYFDKKSDSFKEIK